MLLDALVEFEKIVNKPSSGGGELTWSTPTECEHYVERLQQASEKLTRENRLLLKVHKQLGEQLVTLMMVDMLRQRDQWKSQWQEVGQQMSGIKSKYRPEQMAKWVMHWDHQMYKVVEAAYRFGLESLNENLQLPDSTKVELVFAQGVLQFKPSIEELRSIYYREMKKFISIPNTFKGFGNAGVYRAMSSHNTGSLVRVYKKAEALFAKLLELAAEYKPWTLLGAVDVDALIEEHVQDVEQYEANFKALRTKRKEAEKIADSVRVDCFNVSLASLKTAIDDQLQHFGDSLLITLRRSILTEFKEVDAYLTAAMEKLSARPHSVDEIAVAQKAWKEIEASRVGNKAISDACVEKKTMLLQYAPMSAVDTTEVTTRLANLNGEGGRWDTLEIAMEAFSDMIDEQKEALKTVLEEQVIELNVEIDKFSQRWLALKPKEMASWERDAVLKVFADLDGWKEALEKLEKSCTDLAESCESFGMATPSFGGLEAVKEDVSATLASWGMLREYMDEIQTVSEQDWIGFRNNIFALQDIATAWMEKVKAAYAAGAHDLVTKRLKEELERVKLALPALKFCHGRDFKDDHWSQLLQGKLGLPKSVRLENLTVGHFLMALETLAQKSLFSFVKQLQARAQGEVLIREALEELQAWSVTAELKLLEHEEAGRTTNLIKDWKDLFLELGDKQSLLSSLKESQFYKAFADRGAVYEQKLATLDACLHTLNSIQRKWVYLEPIFERGALPQEQRRFRGVDEEFRDIMGKITSDPKLFTLCDEHVFHNLRESLTAMLDQLERCQKALAEFLEEKRDAFSRFYFIGDDDLLEILGQAKNPAVIQSHLKKLFQGINKVQFNEGNTGIVAMISSMGEVVPLEGVVTTTDRVEEWLTQLADEMKSSLTANLAKCLKSALDYDAYSSQVLCIAECVKFSSEIEANLTSGLSKLGESLREMLIHYTSQDLTRNLVMQSKVKALILDLVHHMDVVAYLDKARCEALSDWAWHKQLRYYLRDDGTNTAEIRMCDASFNYTYEYQGNAPKLVHTPLTDKCYLTLTQGMHMGFGGNPYGPAGTGKTESVKALGNAFGRQVLVFNCDEGIDFQSMGRIFIGLVKCGAWGCFDEFNRLKEDQLSAISQQIQIIQDGIKHKTPQICLLGHTIPVDLNAGIFVTLNPAGKDYGGRSNLPDNLKALFRPVAMGRPDNELISEVMLYSEGFSAAKDLAGKIVALFTLSKELLSAQQHYDWGLRALKAVLNTGGKLVQASKRDGEQATPKLERELLIKAVRVNTLSKLTFADTGRFLALIGDVFPDTDSSDIAGGDLEVAIREVMVSKEFGLSVDETQIRKMLQLKESLDQRMGCVVVGPSGCGKSAVWRVLQAAMIKCGQKVVIHVMNPKSMPRQQLLGDMDLDTREWSDGVLTDAARKVVKEPPEVRSWGVAGTDGRCPKEERLSSFTSLHRDRSSPGAELDRVRRRRRPRVDRVAQLGARRQPPAHAAERRAHLVRAERQFPFRGRDRLLYSNHILEMAVVSRVRMGRTRLFSMNKPLREVTNRRTPSNVASFLSWFVQRDARPPVRVARDDLAHGHDLPLERGHRRQARHRALARDAEGGAPRRDEPAARRLLPPGARVRPQARHGGRHDARGHREQRPHRDPRRDLQGRVHLRPDPRARRQPELGRPRQARLGALPVVGRAAGRPERAARLRLREERLRGVRHRLGADEQGRRRRRRRRRRREPVRRDRHLDRLGAAQRGHAPAARRPDAAVHPGRARGLRQEHDDPAPLRPAQEDAHVDAPLQRADDRRARHHEDRADVLALLGARGPRLPASDMRCFSHACRSRVGGVGHVSACRGLTPPPGHWL